MVLGLINNSSHESCPCPCPARSKCLISSFAKGTMTNTIFQISGRQPRVSTWACTWGAASERHGLREDLKGCFGIVMGFVKTSKAASRASPATFPVAFRLQGSSTNNSGLLRTQRSQRDSCTALMWERACTGRYLRCCLL